MGIRIFVPNADFSENGIVKKSVTISVQGDGVLPLVTLSTNLSDAKIYYTTNGSTPTAQSTEYSEPFAVTESCTIYAIAISSTDSTAIANKSVVAGTPTVLADADLTNTQAVSFSSSLANGNAVLMRVTNVVHNNTDVTLGTSIFVDRSNYTPIVKYMFNTGKKNKDMVAFVKSGGSSSAATDNVTPNEISATDLIRVKMAAGFTNVSAHVKVIKFT